MIASAFGEPRPSLDQRINRLPSGVTRHSIDRQLDEAITDNINEISEAVGRVYDEYPNDLSMEEGAYYAAAGAREALHLLLKELDIDPESVRKGWWA